MPAPCGNSLESLVEHCKTGHFQRSLLTLAQLKSDGVAHHSIADEKLYKKSFGSNPIGPSVWLQRRVEDATPQINCRVSMALSHSLRGVFPCYLYRLIGHEQLYLKSLGAGSIK